MTDIIDSINPRTTPGRSKAVTLFALTTVGSFLKLVFIGLWLVLAVALEQTYGGLHANKQLRWIIFTGVLIILFGLINFAGSLLMLKRVRAGWFVYLAGQVMTLSIFTYSMLALSGRIGGSAMLFLAFVWVVTGVFVALYKSNKIYYNGNKPFDNSFFESADEERTKRGSEQDGPKF